MRLIFAVSGESPPAPPAPGLRQPLVVPPYFSAERTTPAAPATASCFSFELAMLAAYWGKVSSDDALQLHSRPVHGTARGPGPAQSALRSLGRRKPRTFHQWRSPPTDQRDRPPAGPVSHRLGCTRPQLQPMRASATGPCDGYEASGWIHNDPIR